MECCLGYYEIRTSRVQGIIFLTCFYSEYIIILSRRGFPCFDLGVSYLRSPQSRYLVNEMSRMCVVPRYYRNL